MIPRSPHISKQSNKKNYYTSTGEKVSQQYINSMYSKAKYEKHVGKGTIICECQGSGCTRIATSNDHTISQQRLKWIQWTELIWNPFSFVSSCLNCHMQWESYKSGDFTQHANYAERMAFVKKYDLETYKKRLNF